MPCEMDTMLEFNKGFVERKEYEAYRTDKLPDKKLAVLSCMDTRLTSLLPAALNFKNGDVKIIKNAGAAIMHPFGSTMRSLLMCVYELGVREIAVVGHHDCGMQHLDPSAMKRRMRERGIPEERIRLVESLGVNLDAWLTGFDSPTDSVRRTVAFIRNHPLMPGDILIRGFLMDPETGAVEAVEDEEGGENKR